MNVLQLVTTPRPFFSQQVSVLERLGITCRTVAVPRTDPETTRSMAEYLRCYANALAAAPWSYDLIHANYGLTAPLALAQPTRPVVLSLWGSDVYGTYGRLSRLCAELVDEVIVMSEAMAAELDCECHVIPHGIDLSRFEPQSTSDAQQALGWDRAAAHVLFPYSPDREEKNYPRAERVVAAVRDRLDVPVRLQVVSGVAHDRIPTYMNAADALLLTSTHEGSPNAVKEALACNTPVVSLDVGDVATLLSDVGSSTVCDDDGELIAALTETLQTPTPADGREAVRPLSLDRIGEQLRGVYRSALQQSGSETRT